MTRKLLLILLALVLLLPLSCVNKTKAPEQALQVYPTEMENQGFSNAMMQVEETLKKCESALTNCPDIYNEAQRLKAEAYAAWVRCDSAQAWDLIKQALAKAEEACACPAQAPAVEEAKPVVLKWDNALFDFDKSNIRPDAAEVLNHVADDLKANPDIKVIIVGNTDSVGTDEYNMALSERRAKSAEAYLIKAGVDPSQIHSIKAKGELFPAFPNINPFNRQKNRRVEIIQYK